MTFTAARFGRFFAVLIRLAREMAASKRFRTALPVLLAAYFTLLSYRYRAAPPATELGAFLLAGLPYPPLLTNMPLYPAAFSFFQYIGVSAAAVLAGLHLCLYALVFAAGCLLGGYWAGALSLAGAGSLETAFLFSNPEQVFYSVFVLLVQCLLLIRRREGGQFSSLLCGLAIGASLLVRTPLFLFPLVVVCFDWRRAEDPAVFLRRALLFLGACYILLLPRVFMIYSLSGKVELFETSRAASNIITAAEGSVYTMEGNARNLAGLQPGDSAASFYLRRLKEAPLFHVLTVLRRLWHIFLLHPLLFGLTLAAIAAGRAGGKAFLFMLPAYFIAVHSLLSIEARYFTPLIYLLPPLAAGTFLGKPGASQDLYRPARAAAGAVFCVIFCAALGLAALLAVYPRRVARNALDGAALSRAAALFPDEPAFYARRCRELWRNGDDAGFYSCLGGYNRKFGDKVTTCILTALASASPEKIPTPACGGAGTCPECAAAKMLRELELGDETAAARSFRNALAEHQKLRNMLRGEPYARDKEIAGRLKRDISGFDRTLYELLVFWPPAGMAKIFPRLEKMILPSGQLKELGAMLKAADGQGKAGEMKIREWAAGGLFGQPYPAPGRGN
ncbi:MAG TPA: hypothetical protein PKI19_00535 [Elusimicrobiales bacterium]|nr:hypothetical protein [Elusimicrobiales bacterium]